MATMTDDALGKFLAEKRAQTYYVDGAGLVGIYRARQYQWHRLNLKSGRYEFTGSTQSSGGAANGVSKHRA